MLTRQPRMRHRTKTTHFSLRDSTLFRAQLLQTRFIFTTLAITLTVELILTLFELEQGACALPLSKDLEDFAKAAAALQVSIDSDFQMDKFFPNWGRSPQPGPTYSSIFLLGKKSYIFLTIQSLSGTS